jgi:hypothetical protein
MVQQGNKIMILSAKEKAKELVENFYSPIDYNLVGLFSVKNTVSKQLALFAVDEILKVAFFASDEIYNHYLEVKQEIENYE